mmetsp:Transcript_16394/g.45675  ORF Transcript_16394/g.45675 Transcript_16394/m.45675 type:complete len:213 (+) Transcript_16394:892-1530(+)
MCRFLLLLLLLVVVVLLLLFMRVIVLAVVLLLLLVDVAIAVGRLLGGYGTRVACCRLVLLGAIAGQPGVEGLQKLLCCPSLRVHHCVDLLLRHRRLVFLEDLHEQPPLRFLALHAGDILKRVHLHIVREVSGHNLRHNKAIGKVPPHVLNGERQVEAEHPLKDVPRQAGRHRGPSSAVVARTQPTERYRVALPLEGVSKARFFYCVGGGGGA